jgi:hypothetical protein
MSPGRENLFFSKRLKNFRTSWLTVSIWPMNGRLSVPTVDHIAVPPVGGRIFVFGDDERYDIISSLLVTRITVDKPQVSSEK